MNEEIRKTAEKHRLIAGYSLQPASLHDLHDVYRALDRVLGRPLIPIETVARFQRKNSDSVRLVHRLNDVGQPLPFGAIIALFPLTPAAARAMSDGHLSALALRSDHISPPGAACRTAYLAVGAVISDKTRDYGAGFVYLARSMRNHASVLTSPITREGLNFCMRMGFAPVQSGQPQELGVLHAWKNPDRPAGTDTPA